MKNIYSDTSPFDWIDLERYLRHAAST